MATTDPFERAAARGIEAVVVGASAGGFEALMRLLTTLPAGYPLPFAIVMHLPDHHESRLAELFGYRIALPAREARDKEAIEPGVVYFAPPAYHLLIERDRSFSLSCDERVNHARPSIDVLLQSAADAYGDALCGIILTGANYDGADGLAGIRIAGGLAVVQDPEEAESGTMPKEAIRRAHPDFVLPLADISRLLLALGRPKTTT